MPKTYGTTKGSSGTTSPGGSSPQVQYNNSGAFGGVSMSSVNSGGGIDFTIPNTASTSSAIKITNNNSTGLPLSLYIINNASSEGMRFEQNAVMGASKTCFAFFSNQAHVNGDAYLIKMENISSSATQPMTRWINASSDSAFSIEQRGNAMIFDLVHTNAGSNANFIKGNYNVSSPAGNFIQFQNNGSDKFIITSLGKTSIGTGSPTALLLLGAGTATANTAPLKFTTGTLLTSAEVGAVEFLTDAYYGTVTTGAVRGMFALHRSGRVTAQNAAASSILTYTLPAVDATFTVSANVLVTTSTVHNFTVTVSYTDEGNTARTLTLPFSILAGTLATAITNAGGTVPYEGVPLHIRCKASTAITFATVGTFTTVTYNAEASLTQIA